MAEENNWHSKKDDIADRLAEAWLAGNVDAACGIIIDEVQPRCIRWLRSRYWPTLSEQDCEDCFSYGVEALLNRKGDPGRVPDPYDYLYTCARGEAVDIIEEKKKCIRYDPEWAGASPGDPNGAYPTTPSSGSIPGEILNAITIVESVTEAQIEAALPPSKLLQALKLSFLKLTDQRKKMAQTLLDTDALASNKTLAEYMSLTEGGAKSLKKRTLDDLRRYLPKAAESVGLRLEDILKPDPDLLTESPPLTPREDDDVRN